MKNSKFMAALAACILALAMGCGGATEEPAATPETSAGVTPEVTPFDPSTGTAAVTGTVAFDGELPRAAQIRMNADPVCVGLHSKPVYSEEVVVTDGKLQNVFVYVKEGLERYTFPTPAEPAILDQSGCHYTPHVGGMMVNQKLQIKNSDPTLHNIHCWAEKNDQFNIGQPIQGMTTERTFTQTEVMVPFKCDVHKWMSSYIGVLPHPYFSVTGADGTFTLRNLPPGEYLIEAWHEKYGTKTQKVTVADAESKEIGFSFGAS